MNEVYCHNRIINFIPVSFLIHNRAGKERIRS